MTVTDVSHHSVQKQRYVRIKLHYQNMLKQKKMEFPAEVDGRKLYGAGVIHFMTDLAIAFSSRTLGAASALFHEFQHDELSASPDSNSRDKYITSSTV